MENAGHVKNSMYQSKTKRNAPFKNAIVIKQSAPMVPVIHVLKGKVLCQKPKDAQFVNKVTVNYAQQILRNVLKEFMPVYI